MRKLIVCCMLVLTLITAACGAKTDHTYTVTREGGSFVVNTVDQTISHENQLYKYEIQGNTIELTYPDQSTYWRTYQDNSSYGGGWSDDYVEGKYTSSDILLDVLSYEPTNTEKSNNIFLIILLLVTGIFNVIFPDKAWYISRGWQYKNAEPSELALGATRAAGLVGIVIAIIMFFV